MSISDLSIEVIGLLRRHPAGVKLADILTVIRKPHQEVEAALSQLKRQGYAKQSSPGIWTALELGHPGAPPPRPDLEPDHHAIPAQLEHLDHRPGQPITTSLIRPPAAVRFDSLATGRRHAATPADKETAMPKGTKKCTKCGAEKGMTAFFKGDDVCRFCHGGKTAKARKEQKPSNGKLRTIVKKHARRLASAEVASTGHPEIDAAIATFTARRDRLNQAIAALQGLG